MTPRWSQTLKERIARIAVGQERYFQTTRGSVKGTAHKLGYRITTRKIGGGIVVRRIA